MTNISRCLVPFLSVASLAAAPANSPPEDGAQQFASFGDFRQSGAITRQFRLGYPTLGKLNADRSNASLFPGPRCWKFWQVTLGRSAQK